MTDLIPNLERLAFQLSDSRPPREPDANNVRAAILRITELEGQLRAALSDADSMGDEQYRRGFEDGQHESDDRITELEQAIRDEIEFHQKEPDDVFCACGYSWPCPRNTELAAALGDTDG